MKHPLDAVSISAKNFKSFGNDMFPMLSFQPINILIGRNNSGKSSLIDLVDLFASGGQTYDATKHNVGGRPFTAYQSHVIDEPSLRKVFREDTSGGQLNSNHWDYGKQFIGANAIIELGSNWSPQFADLPASHRGLLSIPSEMRSSLARSLPRVFENKRLLRVAAERDVQPEPRENNREITPKGRGVTNLVRAFINSDDLPRAEVEVGLLSDLNEIYMGDSQFTAIVCRENQNGIWEIFLREENKGDIRLSESGSSLKSIFIVLCTLRLLPKIQEVSWNNIILSVEEPENNLHPALLRRLLNFLAERRAERGFSLIIATHSPVGIDWSTKRTDSQIIHVKHDGVSASAHVAIGYNGSRDILDDLDIRASDILQANGVIWVEGPSDRIYLNKWIELSSDNTLKEGVHYSIMFYGGKLLSHLHAMAPPGEASKLISLLSLNRNAALLMDSDRHLGKPARDGKPARKPRMNLNGTKTRLKDELSTMGGYVWVTEGREVENYISNSLMARATGIGAVDVGPYETVIESPALNAFNGDKIAFAHRVAELAKKEDLSGHLDLATMLAGLCDEINGWNGSQ
ncbi:ATP-dependent nuclease [Mesorhizobium sp. CA16]|uniref:ATP-dependent nuclease n=1 Tax=Mesorhizobium sp. CA16 TaxID=588496 RepID=UPI001CCED66E|nr:AAA family ATPase [Mesorhizobium sp. CA16]MBZ9915699.1 AAA family ATPase [Mesorhizobium sp. CA16]